MDIFLDELDNSSVESAENTIQDELIEQQLQNTTNDDLFEAEQSENIAPIADTSSSVPNIDTDSFGLDTDGSADIFKNADLEISNDLKGSEINVFEAGAQAADHIIALDSPEEQVSTELVKLPGIQDVQSKVTAIKLEDNTPESYLKVASSIDLILQDLN